MCWHPLSEETFLVTAHAWDPRFTENESEAGTGTGAGALREMVQAALSRLLPTIPSVSDDDMTPWRRREVWGVLLGYHAQSWFEVHA